MPSCAELFTGCGGLALGLERAGFTHSWFCESDPACREVLARRFPGVPIMGDVRDVGRVPAATEADRELGPQPDSGQEGSRLGTPRRDDAPRLRLDLLAGGFPCQPFSTAGKRRGEQDDRYLWPEFARTIRLLRPRTVLLENVPGILSMALDSGEPVFGRVLADLAEAGYDTEWFCVRASDLGAPHRRERVFVVAHAESEWGQAQGRTAWGRRPGLADRGGDAAGDGDSPATTYTDELRREESEGVGLVARERSRMHGEVAWGIYEPAIRRWEAVTRPAPRPTDDRGRLDPRFPEWMLGFPEGWVDGVTRTAQLRMLGNAVQVQVAELVGRELLRFVERNAA